jgi:hypothetical protein
MQDGDTLPVYHPHTMLSGPRQLPGLQHLPPLNLQALCQGLERWDFHNVLRPRPLSRLHYPVSRAAENRVLHATHICTRNTSRIYGQQLRVLLKMTTSCTRQMTRKQTTRTAEERPIS